MSDKDKEKKSPEGAKETVKEVPSNATQEELKKLRHEVETGRLSKNPDDYNHAETKLDEKETLEQVLEKIFSQKGGKVPKGSVERIQVALTSIGLDLEKLRKENGVDAWKVEKGKLIFMATKEGGKKDIFLMPLLPWKALNEKIEAMEEMKHNYDLGVYNGAPGAGEGTTSVEGSVDATPFGKKLEKPEWYNDKINAAGILLDLYHKDNNRFDTDTQGLIASYETKLKGLKDQNGKTPQQIRTDFESKYSSAEIIGSEGIYNFVLAFQRVLDAYNGDAEKLEKGGANIRLVIGKTVRSKDERYVKTTALPGGALPGDEGGIIVSGDVSGREEEGPEEYRDVELLGEHMAVRTGPGSLLPSAEQYKEQINTDVASKELLASYSKNGTKALVEGLKKIPEEQRQVVLEAIFAKLGEDDPKKAFQLMKEIMKYEKGEQETAVYEGLKENMEKAPNENEKNFWKMQMLLFETSQAGDMDEKGNLRLSYNQSQNKMREAYQLVAKIDEATLPEELKEMFKQQKQYLETSLRQSLAVDMLDTFVGTADSIFQNDKDSMEDLEEMKQKSREEIAEAISGGIDYDEDVYVSIKHCVEAISLAITYQYPKDVAEGKKIENPIKHYHDEIRQGRLSEIKLEEGMSVPVNDILQDTPKVFTGSIKLDDLFVAKEDEFDLFDQYQRGEEALDPTTGWKLLGYIHSDLNLGDDWKQSFLQWGAIGGFVKASDKYFPPLGEINKFMINEGKEMGTIEQLQWKKIDHLIHLKNYDEARALCVQILEDRLNAHKKNDENDIRDKAYELEKDYGEKIAAQIRIQLEEKNINSAALAAQKIERPGGGFYTDISDYIHDRVKMALAEKAVIALQSETCDDLSDEEVSQMTALEKQAYDVLETLNGNNFASLGLSAETWDVVADVTRMVVEIIVIEVATMGLGSYLAGAAAAAEGTALAARAGSVAVRMGEVGTNLSRVARIENAMFRAGRASRLGTVLGGRAGAPIRYLYEGNTMLARGARTYLHGATFVEAQSLMHGNPVNPFSIKGQMEIATAATTMFALGKINQFTRGATAGARMAEEGALRGGLTRGAYEGFRAGGWRGALKEMGARGGWRALPGIRGINRASAQLGRFSRGLAESTTTAGKVGSKLYTGGEIALEIYALNQLGDFQQDVEIMLGETVFKDSGLLTEDEKKAMKDPETWHQVAHTAGVVLGLRTWRYAQNRMKPTYYDTAIGKSKERFTARRAEYAKEGRLSESVRDNPTASLEFAREHRGFFDRMKTSDPFRFSKVEAFSKGIKFEPSSKAVVAIPCFAREANLGRTLENYAKQTNKNFEIVICLNAGSRLSAAEFQTEVTKRQAEIEEVRKKHPDLRIHTFEMHFSEPRPELGNVRAYLAEVISKGASKSGLKDPIVISNDADCLGLNEGYVDSFIKKFEASPKMDYALGQIEWDASFKNPDSMTKNCPELLIGQRMMQITDMVIRHKSTGESSKNIGSSGANTAYRLRSYLASGGYDTNVSLAEDVALGNRLKYMRYQAGSGDLTSNEYQGFSTNSKLQTSPRRALDAILNGLSVTEQWGNFNNKVGASLDDASAVKKYTKSKDYIQKADIEAAKKGDTNALNKIKKRTEFILERLFIEYRIRDVTRITQVLDKLGIKVTTKPENWQFNVDGNGRTTRIKGIEIDPSNSSALNYMYNYYQV